MIGRVIGMVGYGSSDAWYGRVVVMRGVVACGIVWYGGSDMWHSRVV